MLQNILSTNVRKTSDYPNVSPARAFSERDRESWVNAGRCLTRDVVAVIDDALATLSRHHEPTARHAERVADTVGEFALFLGLPELAAEGLHQATRLHDMGKTGTPAAMLFSDRGTLTAAQYEFMKLHVPRGAEIIAAMPGLPGAFRSLAIQGAMGHHEHFIGNGFPQRLAGYDIPPFARLIKIADVYDAVAVRGGYQAPLPALATLRKMGDPKEPYMAGQFDPELLPHFTRLIERRETLRVQFSGTGLTRS